MNKENNLPKSVCCNTVTKIGYYSDVRGHEANMFIVAKVGTYCSNCNKLCDYHSNNKYYHYDGSILDIKLVRKMKLNILKEYDNSKCK